MTFPNLLQKHGLSAQEIKVWAFIPYSRTEAGLVSECYDNPLTRRELAEVFEALGLEWHWTPVTRENLIETVETVVAASNGRVPVVLNYCDGDEIYGDPGITVIRQLEEKGLAFTGADAAFYHISTSKILMKQAFLQAGVSTAPFAVIEDSLRDTPGLCAQLGAPLIVKPAVSGGSFGLSLHSVVHDDAELGAWVAHLLQGEYGPEFALGGIFAERFINGPEFTVLVLGSPGFPETVRILPPVERAFNPRLPEEERFFSYDRYWEIYKEETPPPDGERLYEYRLAEEALQQRLGDLAWQAYCAVGGSGYGRVDIRMDKSTGELFVLEVNANCGVSSPEDDSSVGNILGVNNIPFSQLMSGMLLGALARNMALINVK